jgi:hypothetical protein
MQIPNRDRKGVKCRCGWLLPRRVAVDQFQAGPAPAVVGITIECPVCGACLPGTRGGSASIPTPTEDLRRVVGKVKRAWAGLVNRAG